MSNQVLVRYGAIGEVARFGVETDQQIERNERVVIRTVRGLEVGTLLESVGGQSDGETDAAAGDDPAVLRVAGSDDESALQDQAAKRAAEFEAWQTRIAEWKVDLQLIDLEWTLDGEKLILYVLNDRGPACTTLALQAAAAGLGVIEVQPVDHEGPVRLESGAAVVDRAVAGVVTDGVQNWGLPLVDPSHPNAEVEHRSSTKPQAGIDGENRNSKFLKCLNK